MSGKLSGGSLFLRSDLMKRITQSRLKKKNTPRRDRPVAKLTPIMTILVIDIFCDEGADTDDGFGEENEFNEGRNDGLGEGADDGSGKDDWFNEGGDDSLGEDDDDGSGKDGGGDDSLGEDDDDGSGKDGGGDDGSGEDGGGDDGLGEDGDDSSGENGGGDDGLSEGDDGGLDVRSSHILIVVSRLPEASREPS